MLLDQRPVSQPGEAPVSDLFTRLIDDGKAYARAEAEVVKAKAMDRVEGYKAPVALFIAAAFFAFAAVIMLCALVGVAIAQQAGPIIGALGATLFGFTVAAVLALIGKARLGAR